MLDFFGLFGECTTLLDHTHEPICPVFSVAIPKRPNSPIEKGKKRKFRKKVKTLNKKIEKYQN